MDMPSSMRHFESTLPGVFFAVTPLLAPRHHLASPRPRAAKSIHAMFGLDVKIERRLR